MLSYVIDFQLRLTSTSSLLHVKSCRAIGLRTFHVPATGSAKCVVLESVTYRGLSPRRRYSSTKFVLIWTPTRSGVLNCGTRNASIGNGVPAIRIRHSIWPIMVVWNSLQQRTTSDFRTANIRCFMSVVLWSLVPNLRRRARVDPQIQPHTTSMPLCSIVWFVTVLDIYHCVHVSVTVGFKYFITYRLNN